jgi:hypothetical protein
MKHPLKYTVVILAWLLAAILFSYYLMPIISEQFHSTVLRINQYAYAGIVISMILISAFIWAKLFKNLKPRYIDLVFTFAIGVFAARALSLFIPMPTNGVLDAIVRTALMAICIFTYWVLLKCMQKSWKHMHILIAFSNIYILFVTVFAASMLGMDLAPIVAFIILGAASLYDAWAVWKSKTMVKMAKYFISRRIIPGIGVAYEEEGKLALLGVGDVLFIIFISASLYKMSIALMLATTFGMVLAVALMFLWSKKDTFYPALPFIFIGATIGLFAGVLL